MKLLVGFVANRAHHAEMGYISIIALTGLSFTLITFTSSYFSGFDEEDKMILEMFIKARLLTQMLLNHPIDRCGRQ